jgi:phosphoribosyl 1,2-cyclic phosphodiesterase
MQFSVLSSGSKANVTLVQCGDTRLLIDCGLVAKHLEGRLHSVGVDPSTIDAILVSHEHSDHVLGLSVFSERHRIPVYMNDGTSAAFHSRRLTTGKRRKHLYHEERLGSGKCGKVGSVDVETFGVSHDAADPVGFRLTGEGLIFVHCTDLGRVTTQVADCCRGAHALVLESNYDDDLLERCEYPWELKQRIRSTHGHLSNHSAGNLIAGTAHTDLSYVVLAHLSEHSNTPEVAFATVSGYLSASQGQHAGSDDRPWRASPRLVCASRDHHTEMFDLRETACDQRAA